MVSRNQRVKESFVRNTEIQQISKILHKFTMRVLGIHSTTPLRMLVVLLLFLSGASHQTRAFDPGSLTWESRAAFPGGGRHHPICFANATHGFVLTGSTLTSAYTSDLWVYEAATDTWTDLSETSSAFPGAARTQSYGVAATLDCSNTKAYLGFGFSDGTILNDWWEFDMATHEWKQLAEFPGEGRRHPAMNFVEPLGEIHVGLGDGIYGNYDDYWSYNIEKDEWKQLADFPSSQRHHPFMFSINSDSYVGLGHDNVGIERDWYRYDAVGGRWNKENDFASYSWSDSSSPITTEARVAGTEFSVAGSCDSETTLGFVLSGDGDDHSSMASGEFHVFDPQSSHWHELPPHPGFSRWAPGSFVLMGTSQVYFFGGYDRLFGIYNSDLWTMDMKPLFVETDSFEGSDSDTMKVNGDSSLAESSASRSPNRLYCALFIIVATSSLLALVL